MAFPLIRFRVITKRIERESRPATNGSIRCDGDAHDVPTFTRIVKPNRFAFASLRVFNDQNPFRQIQSANAFAVGKDTMEQALRASDERFRHNTFR